MFLGAGCGHLRILGNGCGRRKRFTTAHCGFERSKHNGRLFVRSAKWRVLHLFFGSWLAAAALQWKSQNRRKCDGKGSNLQHLKDNWPAAALLGKSIVKCWMSQKFPPASSDEVFTTGFQDFKIVSRVCYFQEGGKSKLKMRKNHIFLHHIANSILPWPWLEKESLGNGNHFERLKVGRSFASVCRNARHLNQITNNCSKKRKNKQFSNATPGCSWFPNKKN